MHSNNIDKVTGIAQQAFKKMHKLSIPANPNNYVVWYHYFEDSFPDLKHEIDALLKNGEAFDDAQCAKIHSKHFTTDSQSAFLESTSTNIESVIDRAVKYLEDAGSDAAEFGETLADASGGLTAQSAPNDARDIIVGVVSATQQMSQRQKDLEGRLVSASNEVFDLRKEIEVARLEAATDGLTGLANRKRFDTTLSEAAAKSVAAGTEMSLLMLDIDHFKKFNDNHGHQTGDQVLKLLGRILKDCIKGQDTAARYGGEEFCVILPQTSLKSAMHLANIIRDRVARNKITNRMTGEQLGAITLSIGAAKYEAGEPLADLVSRADIALYAAKNHGRNCVLSELDIAS